MNVRVVLLILAIGCAKQEPSAKHQPSADSESALTTRRATSAETRVLRVQITGLHCGCGAQVREALAPLLGVVRVDGDFLEGRIEIEHDPALATEQMILDALDRAGHAARVLDEPLAQTTAR